MLVAWNGAGQMEDRIEKERERGLNRTAEVVG